MSLSAVLLGLLYTALYCAVIILVAFAILWILNYLGFSPSAEVLRWGKIVVALLCLIAIVIFILSLLPGGAAYQPRFSWRW